MNQGQATFYSLPLCLTLTSAGNSPDEGWGQTTSEMGHLYFVSLGAKTGGAGVTTMGDTTPFEKLYDYSYWSGTEESADLLWAHPITLQQKEPPWVSNNP